MPLYTLTDSELDVRMSGDTNSLKLCHMKLIIKCQNEFIKQQFVDLRQKNKLECPLLWKGENLPTVTKHWHLKLLYETYHYRRLCHNKDYILIK